MPNLLSATGLQIATQAELLSNLTEKLRTAYGSDINLDLDSPDGQMVNIYVQAALDVLGVLAQLNSSFDPDQAMGVILDQRVGINGIQRQAGTYTLTNVTITTSKALTLYGLDQTAQPVYTVQDNAGHQWELVSTQTPAGAGSYVYAFQAANPGAVYTVPNSITQAVTIILGVTAINNPTTYTSLGLNEETDAALRVRRQKSVSLSSQGYLSGLLGALESISGLTFSEVFENNSATTDADGIPSHSIWVIVQGGANADVANAIYAKRNAGCGMKGSQSFTITQADGSPFLVSWDLVTPQDLFVKFTANSLDGVNPPDIASIQSGLVTSFVPGVYSQVNINEIGTLVQDIDSNTMITGAGFCLTVGGSYQNTLRPTSKNNQFSVSGANIIVLPMILKAPGYSTVISSGLVTGSTISVAHGGSTCQFSSLGGYGTLTYSMASGAGSINSTTGLYTSSTAGTDVAQVTDSLGNSTQCTITVT